MMITLDTKLNAAFPGKCVRKDLLHDIKRTVNVPSFVLEFLLSRYCASDDPEEIEDGKKAVLQTIERNYVRPDQSNKAQSIVEQKKRHKFIDKVHVKYYEREKRYWAEMENFGSKRIAINPEFYKKNDKLLESGIWAEVTLAYNEVEEDDYAFYIEDLRPIQLAHFDAQSLFNGRQAFSTHEWIDILIRSVGINPDWLAQKSRENLHDETGMRLKMHILARFIPLVMSNYNSIELGGRSTGKSYFYSEFSPYSTLLSGGQASTATLLYNNQRKQVGAVGYWDNIGFDEVAKMRIKDADTVQIMKDYMANGRFSRGREVTGYASFSFVGNFDLNIPNIVNAYNKDLLLTLPEAFDYAIIDRIYDYIPGWEIPKIDDSSLTSGYGLITDYLSEILHYLFTHNSEYQSLLNKFLKFGDNVEGRDNRAIQRTVMGFLKLLFPVGEPTPEEFDKIMEYAMEGRRRVKEQLNKRKPDEEYANINMSYINRNGEKVVVYCPESKYSQATQNPRKAAGVEVPVAPRPAPFASQSPNAGAVPCAGHQTTSQPITDGVAHVDGTTFEKDNSELEEKTLKIMYGDTGFGYRRVFAPYLKGAKRIIIHEPYLVKSFQQVDLLQFLELVAEIGDCTMVKVYTGPGERMEEKNSITAALDEIADSLANTGTGIEMVYEFDTNAHDRYIDLDNGWEITLGRGLHYFQNINQGRKFLQIGSYDNDMKPCLETKIDFRKIK